MSKKKNKPTYTRRDIKPIDAKPELPDDNRVEMEKKTLDITVIENVTPDNIDEFPRKEDHIYFTIINDIDVQAEYLDYVQSLDRSDMTRPMVLVGMNEEQQGLVVQLGIQKLVEIMAECERNDPAKQC